MEIQNRAQPPIESQKPVVSAVGQKLPSDGNSMPADKVKAPPKVPDFDTKDLDKAVEDLQAYVDGLGRDLSFSRDETVGRNIITVRDSNTNQIVRQIPGEEVLAISRQIKSDLDELRAGMLLRSDV